MAGFFNLRYYEYSKFQDKVADIAFGGDGRAGDMPGGWTALLFENFPLKHITPSRTGV